MSRWYAVRTKPGAQMPRRQHHVEQTRSRKGYRMVSTINPELSAVENALMAAGFDCYMPAEKRLQRDRLRPFLWKPRRFALLVGYIFVREPDSIPRLESVDGVQGVVKDGAGRPITLGIAEILKIRSVEAAAEVEFAERSRHARWLLRKQMRDDPEIKRIVEYLDASGKFTVPLEGGSVAA